MHINSIAISNLSQPQRKNVGFEAVNQKFLNEAQWQYKHIKTVTGDLLERIRYSVVFQRMSKQDAIDTLEAIRQYDGGCAFFEHVLKSIKTHQNPTKK